MAYRGLRSCCVALTAVLIVTNVAVIHVNHAAGEEFEDIGIVEIYWWVNTSSPFIQAGDPINHSIAFRLIPKSMSPEADRIYVPSGNKLIALRPSNGQRAWHNGSDVNPVCCFETSSEISTDPIAANFGSLVDPSSPKYIVYVGTRDGSMYFLQESEADEIDPTSRRSRIPRGEDVLEARAGGSITSIAVYADMETNVNPDEKVFFGTSDGWLYAYPAHFDAAAWDDETWFYDFASDDWSKGFEQERPYRRVGHSLLYDSTREVVHLFGGKGDQVNTELWFLDHTLNWTREEVLYPHTPVDDPALVHYESADAFLLFGGEAGSGDVDQLLRLNLTENEWQSLSPTLGPPPQHGHEMVYSSQDDIMMLFGGLGDVVLNDTWLFSLTNTTWWNLSIPNPWKRFGHSLVYDSVNNRAILFGGSDGNQFFNDTWAYNFQTNSWSQLAIGSAPLPRLNHSMAFHSLSGKMLLFGGKNDTEIFCDTWTFDVLTDTWEKMNPSISPPARFSHNIIVNRSSQRAVLFGGNLGGGNELWKRKFGNEPIRLAGIPLGPVNCPRRSPALNENGTILVANDGIGFLRAINTSNGNQIWSVWIGDSWNTAPVVSPPIMEDGSIEAVAAGSGDGWLYALYVENGTVFSEWDALGKSSPSNPFLHGVQIMEDETPDGGAVTSLSWYEEELRAGTSLRNIYAIRFQAVGIFPQGSTRWSVRTAGTVVSPVYWPLALKASYFVDDSGRLHAVQDNGLIGYRVKLNGKASATPTVWRDESGSGHLHRSVWIGDSLGYVYSLSSSWGVETTPPSISDVRTDPSPQEVHGHVNVSAVVEDASGVESVWIDIEGVGNFSMTYDSSAGRYYNNRTYPSVGTFNFTIAAKDVRENWATKLGQFVIEDTTPPVISHVPVTSAVVHEAIDILATVIDNLQVSVVTINYTGVDGLSHNETMTQSGDNYSYQIRAQNSTGSVTYFIWSEDTEGNIATTPIYTASIVPETMSPSAPTDLIVRTGEEEGTLSLSWNAPVTNTDGSPLVDLASYNVYRMTSSGGGRTLVNDGLVETTTFEDTGLENGKTYYYVVRAIDIRGNESPDSNEAFGTTKSVEPSDFLWILMLLLVIILIVIITVLLLRKRKRGALEEAEDEVSEE